MEIHPEDHGGSPGWRIQKDVEVSQFQYTVKMVNDTAEISEDSADAAGTISLRSWANPMSLAQLDGDVTDVCELGGVTNNSPSDVRSRAPSTIAACVWEV